MILLRQIMDITLHWQHMSTIQSCCTFSYVCVCVTVEMKGNHNLQLIRTEKYVKSYVISWIFQHWSGNNCAVVHGMRNKNVLSRSIPFIALCTINLICLHILLVFNEFQFILIFIFSVFVGCFAFKKFVLHSLSIILSLFNWITLENVFNSMQVNRVRIHKCMKIVFVFVFMWKKRLQLSILRHHLGSWEISFSVYEWMDNQQRARINHAKTCVKLFMPFVSPSNLFVYCLSNTKHMCVKIMFGMVN